MAERVTPNKAIKLKSGLHNIAVEVVDNDGFESMEMVRLKVNGASGVGRNKVNNKKVISLQNGNK